MVNYVKLLIMLTERCGICGGIITDPCGLNISQCETVYVCKKCFELPDIWDKYYKKIGKLPTPEGKDAKH